MPGGIGEQRRAGVLDVFGHAVPGNRVLHRDVVGSRVADVGQEEQPGVEATQAGTAVDEVVATTQHLDAVVEGRMRHPDVRAVLAISGTPPWPLQGEIRIAELGAAGQRRPFGLRPSDHGFLLLQRLPVPHLDVHVDPAGYQIRAAVQPGRRRLGTGRHPDVAVHGRRLLGLDVGGAVLEAEQVARGRLPGRGRGRPAEAELGPTDRDGTEADPGQIPDRVHGDLRILGAGLDAEIAVAAGGVQVVAGKLRQRPSSAAGCRAARREPVPAGGSRGTARGRSRR